MTREDIKFRVDVDTEIELGKCPHLLVGGCTGSGKSYLIKSIVTDILCGRPDVRMFVVDPKSVDYQFLEGSMFKWDGLSSKENSVVKDMWLRRGVSLLTREAIESGYVERLLVWLIERMNIRYRDMMDRGLTEWDGYPIVLVIDELTDLIYWDRSKEEDRNRSGIRGKIESSLVKIAMMGRAAGIHLIMGTQRPDASVLSGQLRSNIGCRICLKVGSDTERRIILGVGKRECGACGNGDRILSYQGEYKTLKRELR